MASRSVIVAILLGLSVIAIIYFGLISDARLPDHPLIRGSNDLVMHALAFGALTALTLPLFGLWTSTVIVWVGIVMIEALQIPMPDRQASMEDVLSGGAGYLAIVAVYLIARRVM